MPSGILPTDYGGLSRMRTVSDTDGPNNRGGYEREPSDWDELVPGKIPGKSLGLFQFVQRKPPGLATTAG